MICFRGKIKSESLRLEDATLLGCKNRICTAYSHVILLSSRAKKLSCVERSFFLLLLLLLLFYLRE